LLRFFSILILKAGIPTKVALSETAQYTVIAFDYYLKVYKNNLKKKTVEEISNIEAKTNASRSSIVALFVNEQAKVIVFITSGKNNMIYATDLEGTLLDSQKLVSSDSYSAFYDTFQNRIVVKSSSTAVRIYRLKIDTFGKFKKLDTEYLCNGHSGKVLDGCFSSDGSRLISIATDKKAIMWDLSGRPFEDATVPKLVIHELSEDYRVIEWCKWLSKDHNTAIVCMIGDHALDYFKFGPNIFEKVDTVEDPHLGSRCEDLVIINKDGKGVGLLSRSWDKVTSWKPKIKDIVE
jgi:WD40 repeat protein